MPFAKNTKVSPERTIEEIKCTLRRYGVEDFGHLESKSQAAFGFKVDNLAIQISVALPSIDDDSVRLTASGLERPDEACQRELEQQIRTRWRALLLAVKAKLEAVEAGISTVEQEFMAFVVVDGRPLGELVIPELKQAAIENRRPRLGLPEPVAS